MVSFAAQCPACAYPCQRFAVALGTEFTVKLRENGRQAMTVAVAVGHVRVEVGGRTFALSTGQAQVFCRGKEAQLRQGRILRGTIVAIDLDAGTIGLLGGDARQAEVHPLWSAFQATVDGRTALEITLGRRGGEEERRTEPARGIQEAEGGR